MEAAQPEHWAVCVNEEASAHTPRLTALRLTHRPRFCVLSSHNLISNVQILMPHRDSVFTYPVSNSQLVDLNSAIAIPCFAHLDLDSQRVDLNSAIAIPCFAHLDLDSQRVDLNSAIAIPCFAHSDLDSQRVDLNSAVSSPCFTHLYLNQ